MVSHSLINDCFTVWSAKGWSLNWSGMEVHATQEVEVGDLPYLKTAEVKRAGDVGHVV
jgi:hypothetical protein